MATQLAGVAARVQVWNRTGAVAERWRSATAAGPGDAVLAVAATPAEAAAGADVVVTCVSNDAALEEVALGDGGLGGQLQPGAVWLDCGTTGLELTARLAAAAQARGASFLDAPITGSKLGAEGGRLTFMVGGDAGALDRVRPLLDAMGRHVVHAGPRVGTDSESSTAST